MDTCSCGATWNSLLCDLIKYFGFELGAQANAKPTDDRWIINGAHDASKLQDYLDGFIVKFVLCKKCKNPETEVVVKEPRIILDCKACGERSDVDLRQKLSSFILKNQPKKGKKDKSTKKSRRERNKGKGDGETNGEANGESNGSPVDSNSDGGDENGDGALDAHSDDELTRRIKAEAEEIEQSQEIDDDDWAVDVSEEAVKARAQELPDDVKRSLVIDDDDDANAFLTPLDFFLLIDCTGTDPSTYSVKGFATKERFFPTVEELAIAFAAGELNQEFNQTTNGSWALLDRKTEMGTRELDEKFSATLLELGGKRYKLDKDQRFVEYMGWSFYMAHSRTLGLMFFDIKFKGERILYELSLQEALAQYGGNQPLAASSAFQDTHYSLGARMGVLLEGFDCPYGSTFLNLTYHEGNHTIISPDSICIFETDIGFPVSRHLSRVEESRWGYTSLGVVKGNALVIRAVATVDNYDYMFDYTFHVDGTLGISVRASGYIQSSPYYKSQRQWGPRIQKATQGSLHSHILTWKADFDIVDSSNSFRIDKLVATQQSQPWFPELDDFEQIELQSSFLKKEERLNYEPNSQAMYCVVNKGKKNAWGETRAYRIVPGRSNVHLPIFNSPFSLKNSEFAKQHLAVTRQHDHEPFANSVQNTNLPWKPQQDFSKFFNEESLDQEDLVVWVNMGMHHFTRSEDVPVTLYSESHASMAFSPHNFFDRAQDSDLMNRRWVVVDQESQELDFEDYGVKLPQCKIRIEEPVLGLNPILEA
ncbi:eukaryotic translation initiation factor 5 [Histoplasma capsulatum H143]|uniref:Amine oxidase n=1 Tax=Ajellomyces capsulatus (strain H143) TaxID=544712 RepID=C6H4D4_AJECH|nr:eukaryotic translation initiation factor 5 [Histoplasma capsulatum H143]